jgi:hypothetical protein
MINFVATASEDDVPLISPEMNEHLYGRRP